MHATFSRYLDYFANAKPETVSDVLNLVTPDLHFVDPFNDVRDAQILVKIMQQMFSTLKDPSFVVTETIDGGDRLCVFWDFHFQRFPFRFGKKHVISGISILRLNADGLVREHVDYWDAAWQFYRYLPFLGIFIRLGRKLLGH